MSNRRNRRLLERAMSLEGRPPLEEAAPVRATKPAWARSVTSRSTLERDAPRYWLSADNDNAPWSRSTDSSCRRCSSGRAGFGAVEANPSDAERLLGRPLALPLGGDWSPCRSDIEVPNHVPPSSSADLDPTFAPGVQKFVVRGHSSRLPGSCQEARRTNLIESSSTNALATTP